MICISQHAAEEECVIRPTRLNFPFLPSVSLGQLPTLHLLSSSLTTCSDLKLNNCVHIIIAERSCGCLGVCWVIPLDCLIVCAAVNSCVPSSGADCHHCCASYACRCGALTHNAPDLHRVTDLLEYSTKAAPRSQKDPQLECKLAETF